VRPVRRRSAATVDPKNRIQSLDDLDTLSSQKKKGYQTNYPRRPLLNRLPWVSA
jgi:hypothetical protein